MRYVATASCLLGAGLLASAAAAQPDTVDKPPAKQTAPRKVEPLGAPAPTPKSVKDGQEKRRPIPQTDPQKVR